MLALPEYADHLRLTLPAVAASVPALRRGASAFAARKGASSEQQAAVALAVDEAVTNAVLHAYAGAPAAGDIVLDAHADHDQLVVSVTDHGCGMRPRTDSPGLGLGLALISKVTDGLEVTGANGPGTRLRMVFAL